MFGRIVCAFSPKNDPRQPLMERLESRTLLSGVWTGVDADGDLLTVTLRGPGELTVTGGQSAAIDTVSAAMTTPASVLTIDVHMAGNGDGRVDVNQIAAPLVQAAGSTGSLKSINAPMVDLLGGADGFGLEVDGSLRTLRIGSLQNGADVRVGNAAVATAITVGSVGASSAMSFAGSISTFRTGDFGSASSLSAASIGRMQVAGQMAGNLTTQGSVASIFVGGSIAGAFNVGGGVGSIRAGSTDPAFSAAVSGGIGSVRIAGTMALTSLTAASIGALRADSIIGGNITLNGNPDQTCLSFGSLTVPNVIQAAVFRIKGCVGSVRAGAMISSDIFLGVDPQVTGMQTSLLPNDGIPFSDLFDGVFTLRRVTITGPRDSTLAPNGDFVDSNIFASTIERAQLRSINLSNSGTPFGLAAEVFGNVVVRQPTQVSGRTVLQTFRLGGTWLPNPQDFHVQFAVDTV